LGDFEKGFTAPQLAKWLAQLQHSEVIVSLPKFTVSSGFEMSNVLSKLGMASAFDRNRADFSGMNGSGEKLFLSAVLHKTFVDLNEEGTEAAVATAVMAKGGSKQQKATEPFTFRADHPFVFLIRDRRTDGSPFIGRVTNPVP